LDGGGQRVGPRDARGKKTGPNPTDRRKAGSKHHIVTDARGVPLVAHVTAANVNDITHLDALVADLPAVRGRRGRPRRRPDVLQGDRGYDSQPHRDRLAARGIVAIFGRRRTSHGSGLGVFRWVVERTLAWLRRFRRLAVRYERHDRVHHAFLTLGCALIGWNYLKSTGRVF
jgi:transposase